MIQNGVRLMDYKYIKKIEYYKIKKLIEVYLVMNLF